MMQFALKDLFDATGEGWTDRSDVERLSGARGIRKALEATQTRPSPSANRNGARSIFTG
jgi:hypothetical protein